jgi:endo-1,4-beta-mannosidase
LALFVYLDDCRLEGAWRPVQSPEYFFLGVNIWDLWGRGDDPFHGIALRDPFDDDLRRDILEKLAYLAEKRIPVLRVFLDYHFEIDPGSGLFEEAILDRLDFVISTIRENGWPIRMIISHSTGFDLQTGLSWYAKQAEGDAARKVHAFYTDPRLRKIYKRQLRHVVEHVNGITGVAWKDEPVIWAWDVSNEPRILYGTPGTTYASRTRDMVAWYAEMSGALRRFDPNHRIISGTFYGGDGIEPHEEDYDDWNIWELFTVDSIDALSVQSYVGPHLLRTGPKPILLEEFGYGGRYFQDPTDQKRADNYRWMLLSGEKVYLSGVGALLWQMNWNHGYPDGKEIHANPPSTPFLFLPGVRNRSLDVFEFYLGKYNRLEIEPEIEEGPPDRRPGRAVRGGLRHDAGGR